MGFTLAGIGVIGVAKGVTTLAVALPFFILAVPILDMSTVILKRLARGKSPFIPTRATCTIACLRPACRSGTRCS